MRRKSRMEHWENNVSGPAYCARVVRIYIYNIVATLKKYCYNVVTILISDI